MKHGVTPERVLAVGGVMGLMLVGVFSVLMVTGRVGGDPERPVAAATPAATPKPKPKATATPEPTPEPLSARERASRSAAAEVVRSRGFQITRLRDYDPERTLRVLIGKDSSGGRLAFFFVEDAYIGNDATESSARLRVRAQQNRQVTLGYGVYAPDDEACCPTGGPVEVRFRWDGSSIEARDPVPPPQQRSAAYRID